MNLLASFVALLVQKLGPYFYGVLADLVVKVVEYFKQKKLERERKKAIEDALKRERDAKTAKEQEDAFKDNVDQSQSVKPDIVQSSSEVPRN